LKEIQEGGEEAKKKLDLDEYEIVSLKTLDPYPFSDVTEEISLWGNQIANP